MKGIVDSPSDPSNRLELMYHDPTIFKMLFTYFKNVTARDIHVRCNRTGVTFFARNHGKTSRIIAQVAGSKVNWYYCEREFWFGLNREIVEKMFGSIDKSLGKITISSSKEDTSKITFLFKDFEVGKEQTYRHTVSKYDDDHELYEAEADLAPECLAEFPIEFVLTSKNFKKSVVDAMNYSETLTIQKLGKLPLSFTYEKTGLIYHEVYRDDAKIALRSDVGEEEIFRCTLKLCNVQKLAGSMVSDLIRVYCRANGDILFRSAIDGEDAAGETASDTLPLMCSTLTKLN